MPRQSRLPSEALPPPQLGADGYILEGIVTTLNPVGAHNISPMGPIVDSRLDRLWLRPFRTSTTYLNLKRTGQGVFHVTDDVLLLAHAAVGQPEPPPRVMRAEKVEGVILADACRWYAFEVEWLDDKDDRTSILARVVDRGVQREFFGFNRAKHAVVEAAILATRVHILDPQEITSEFDRLAPLVAKTGAAPERQAFEFLRHYVTAQVESTFQQ
jgi:hypothetical protein